MKLLQRIFKKHCGINSLTQEELSEIMIVSVALRYQIITNASNLSQEDLERSEKRDRIWESIQQKIHSDSRYNSF